MTTGLPNSEKSRIRQLYAEGKVGRKELLEAESASYHGPGTCTFYGTANTNQMLMEIMGLHLPGASFVNPNTPLARRADRGAARRVTEITALGNEYTPIGELVDERAIVNGVVGLHATGGSTNHTLHLVAMARAAGIQLNWDDFADLSEVVPLLCRIYPNGLADVNQFHAAGGMGFLIGELLDAGLLHADVRTVAGEGGLDALPRRAVPGRRRLVWRPGAAASLDEHVLAPVAKPFSATWRAQAARGQSRPGGDQGLGGQAGTPRHRGAGAGVPRPGRAAAAFKRGELERDFVAVVRFQGPKANGMPELHKLTPALGVLQDKGFKVALVTDGRMSGASGKVPAAIHLTPEAADGGADRQGARRRRHPPRRRGRQAGGAGGRGGVGGARARARPTCRTTTPASGASCSRPSAPRSARRTRARPLSAGSAQPEQGKSSHDDPRHRRHAGGGPSSR